MRNYESPVITLRTVESSDIITQSIFSDTAAASAELEW